MKFIKKTFLVLLSLFLLYVIVCLFLPSEIIVVREKNIKADRMALLNIINNLEIRNKWSPLNKPDTNWKVTYFGPDHGYSRGFKFLPEGSETILFGLFREGKEDSSKTALFSFKGQKDNIVNARWEMKTQVSFFGRIYPGLLLDKKNGENLEKSLNSIDSLSHTALAGPVEGVESITSFERKNVMSVLDSCAEKDISFKISMLYGKIQRSFDGETKLSGAQMCIYHSVSPENVVFEAALPVNKFPSNLTDKKILTADISYKKVLVYNYFGSLSDIKTGYAKIFDYMSQNKLKQSGNSVEEFVSDPEKESDPDKWLTKIYVPLESEK